MLGTYHSAGIIEDLSSRIDSWEQWDEMPASLQDLTSYEGDTYGIPFRVKVYPVLINTEIFKENGLGSLIILRETWSEALEAARKMVKVENGVVTQMGVSGFFNPQSNVRGFDLFIQQNGGRFLNDDGTPAFNSERGIEALEFLTNLYHTQWPEGTAPLDETVIRAFIAGKSGMAVIDSYDVLQKALQSGMSEFFDFAKLVKPFRSDRSDGKHVSLYDGDMMFIYEFE